MKTLIVYVSAHHQSAEQVARALVDELTADLMPAESTCTRAGTAVAGVSTGRLLLQTARNPDGRQIEGQEENM